MKASKLTFVALMAALCCAIGPLSIPIGPVPVSLSLFIICAAAALSGPGCGAAAVGIYIALGALGMPVFAGFTGGLERIAGMTGGFIIGYLPCALIVGLMTGGKDVPVWRHAIGMAAGTLSCYICGILWFAAVTKSGLLYAAAVCVLPFLLPDAVKIAAAAVLCPRIRKAIPKIS